MDQCIDAPWWRVIGVSGDLLIGKKDPQLALEQRKRLEAEGLVFDGNGRVPQNYFFDVEPLH